ncbi:MAG: undecaprenyldiphospho-muramoylpentapeptide beta-N-acetylglucosaminyltransferase [Chitinophagaceae bacterium]|jgi:UDP-N-acetylglucosamine--N-acetylmuramyl-(pentapeptide) pyrophosphoryl-undecaprenol N-acetylglucosamine transferase|nr:undecaprenyldiphospho-muramoylpentapeptide beta-N-acetylglucosaminyltransferase [Bacteroidota bacterium]MBP9932314.1 undecaprenyldiphospho-muramoylpentapeptide beta-N-acetylglucosaminyltransferase [Chitinophagaceae bacterium]
MTKGPHIKIIVAGGGTGGHIFPAIAIANAVKSKDPKAEILFVGAKGKMEMEKVPKEGYQIIGLDIVGFERKSLFKNLALPWKLFRSFMHARKILKEFQPDVVIGVGGYASFPVLYMAQWAGIPTLLQEQNSYAGRSNRILGKKAAAICVAYDDMHRFFPQDKIIITGNPVRGTISTNQRTQSESKHFFQLDETKKTIFAFGGSLGARSINETLAEQFQLLIEQGYQVLWQTGTPFFEKAKNAVKGFERQVKVMEFIREMDYAYAAADCIIARAGASSIAELCIVGKPVLFVPFPFASEDHQTHNAMALVNKKAAWMLKDHEIKVNLIPRVLQLLQDPTTMLELSQNIQSYAVTNADQQIAQTIFNIRKK